MPPKKPEKATERVLTRQVTQDQGITLEWQPFGHGGGIDVSEVVAGQTRETAPDTEIEGQANGIELPERNEDLEWDHTLFQHFSSYFEPEVFETPIVIKDPLYFG